MKEALKLSAILNIVVALLSYTITNSIMHPVILIILSVIYFSYLEKDNINKTSTILLALLNLILNPLSGIIMLVSTDKISTEKKEKIKEEKQKIETPLNLGVGLISLSGIILATTNWEIINNITKTVMLIIIGIIFISLSIILEKKLNIKELSKKYYILGNIFIILSVIANGCLEVTSHWFSFNGGGKNLYIALTSIIISLLSQIAYKKYNEEMYKHLTYIGILLSLAFILIQLKISSELILIIVNIVLFIIHIRKQEHLKEYAKYLTYGIGLISVFVIDNSINTIEPIILGTTSIINIFITTMKNTRIEGILGTIIINILTLVTINNIKIDEQIISIIIALTYGIYYLLNLITIENKTFKTLMNIATNIILGIYILINIENSIVLITTALITTIASLINYSKKTIKYENILLPVKITTLGLSTLTLIDPELININYIIVALYLLALLVYLKTTDKTKNISRIIFYILLGISIITNDSYLIPSLIGVITALTFYLIEKNKTSYIVFLITILMSLTYTNILNTTILVSGILLLLIYTLLTLLTLENKTINKINYLAIIIPFVLMISDADCIYELKEIILNLIGIYIVLLISILIIKKDKERNIVATILTSLLMIRIIFIESWMIGLYIGILGLIMILIGIMKKEYKALYIEGIIITIINILYQFKSILTELPLWIYLFLSGIIIIGLVTYKAIKDNER